MSDIAVVDYGMGNLRSVAKALRFVAPECTIVVSSDPATIRDADRVVLPGQSAMPDCMRCLNASGLTDIVRDTAHDRPFLGICLGLQMLFTRSFEDGEYAGLDWFQGDVIRFGDVPGLKVPHMGWNQLRHRRPDCPLLRDVPDGANVYFVHSYYAAPSDPAIVASASEYPNPFAAVIWKDNVYATQFHPEKSQRIGLTMLAKFARL